MTLSRFHRLPPLIALGLVAAFMPLAASAPSPVHASGELVTLGTMRSPTPAQSTSGDYATDTFGDPWDFDNQEDVWPVADVGFSGVAQSSIGLSGGWLSATLGNGSAIALIRDWRLSVLPWGHDGWAHPIDGDRYTRTSLSITSNQTITMAVRFWTAASYPKQQPDGLAYFDVSAGSQVMTVDLLNRQKLSEWHGGSRVGGSDHSIRAREPQPPCGRYQTRLGASARCQRAAATAGRGTGCPSGQSE